MSQPKSRNWCFTLNNYSEEDIERFNGYFNEEESLIKFGIIGKEVGESGTPHLQGFLQLHNQCRLRTLQLYFDGRAHWEMMRGKCHQAIAYCEKDGDFITVGTRPLTQSEKGQKEKRRYEDAWENAVAGNLDEIDADIRIRHYNTLKRITLDHQLAGDVDTLAPETRMRWYYGVAGSGKSRSARDEFPDAYLKMCNKWWDGYSGQETVILEDFDKKHEVLIHHLKIWADIYPFLMEVKGGASKIRPRLVIVTSNYHPQEIWTEPGDLQPILRRFELREFRL